MKVLIELVSPLAKMPLQATPGAAGLDLYSFRTYELDPRTSCLIPTGIALALPPGAYADVRGRSGLASKGILTHMGTIDSDYRGEISVCLFNVNNYPYVIQAGDRIGQLVFHQGIPDLTFEEVEALPQDTARGAGGFGSTGR